jgi:hypothetical protein
MTQNFYLIQWNRVQKLIFFRMSHDHVFKNMINKVLKVYILFSRDDDDAAAEFDKKKAVKSFIEYYNIYCCTYWLFIRKSHSLNNPIYFNLLFSNWKFSHVLVQSAFYIKEKELIHLQNIFYNTLLASWQIFWSNICGPTIFFF